MVLLGCALDMMPLRVYATTYLELMAPDLGAPGAPKTTICPLNMQIYLIVASIFQSMLFMVQFRCALNMTLLCVFATIALELMAISLGLQASGAPEMTSCPLNVQISPIVASIFYISAVYGPIGLCFGYDAPIGPFFHNFRAREPIDRFRVPLLRRRFLRGYLLRGCLLKGLLLRGRRFRGCLFRVRLLSGRLLRECLLKGLFSGRLSG